ncbi:GAF domain-containing protein [Jiangella aurantiaca]|uniref:GAF domain-containing protein n=1 Tax=Jiangella aurantiaca TaxID=2530373 RepID=A0A4R5ACC8_9ACTN|nr:GAF domain-containing protein [Jiangella aurantiaca]TDD67432.1 GAF domain-containing protein [Jiangella aurantiaca]
MTSRLAQAVADAGPGAPRAVRLGESCRSILGADGVAVVLAYTLPQRLTVCVTDDVVASVEDLQDVLGEGPGVDAYRSGTAVAASLGTGDAARRWPLFTEAALRQTGPLTIVAVPVPVGAAVLGVLTAYRTGTGHPAPEAELTTHLAAAVGVTLLHDLEIDHDCDLAETDGEPTGVWAGRAEVHQATGFLVARLGLSPEDALALLRARAYAAGVTLGEIAHQVLDRAVDLTPDGTGGRPPNR